MGMRGNDIDSESIGTIEIIQAAEQNAVQGSIHVTQLLHDESQPWGQVNICMIPEYPAI